MSRLSNILIMLEDLNSNDILVKKITTISKKFLYSSLLFRELAKDSRFSKVSNDSVEVSLEDNYLVKALTKIEKAIKPIANDRKLSLLTDTDYADELAKSKVYPDFTEEVNILINNIFAKYF